MTGNRYKGNRINLQEIFGANQDGLKELLREVLQEVLEQEMTDALGAEKGERSPGRLGYRSGCYSRSLVTRVGKLELRIPLDRQGQFYTQIFERYQRSEKALVSALAEMYIQLTMCPHDVRTTEAEESQRNWRCRQIYFHMDRVLKYFGRIQRCR